MPELTIIIVNYNTRALLHACLATLQRSTIPLAIIVVDNASSDGSAAMVARDYPTVTLLAQTENTWFCGGNNIGIAAATTPYVLLLNPDTEVAPDACERLLTAFKAAPHLAGVTGRLVYPDEAVQRTCSALPTYADLLIEHSPLRLFPAIGAARRAARWYRRWDRGTNREVAVAPGSCLLLRREEALLDGDLRLYFPEEVLARRLKRPFGFVAAAHIVHHEKAATRTWRATATYFRDLGVYTRRYHGIAPAALLWLVSRPLYAGMWAAALWRKYRSDATSRPT